MRRQPTFSYSSSFRNESTTPVGASANRWHDVNYNTDLTIYSEHEGTSRENTISEGTSSYDYSSSHQVNDKGLANGGKFSASSYSYDWSGAVTNSQGKSQSGAEGIHQYIDGENATHTVEGKSATTDVTRVRSYKDVERSPGVRMLEHCCIRRATSNDIGMDFISM